MSVRISSVVSQEGFIGFDGVDLGEEGSSSWSRLRLTHETYLVRKTVCSKFPKRKLKTTILAVVKSDLDGDRGVRRRGRVGTRHDGRRASS